MSKPVSRPLRIQADLLKRQFRRRQSDKAIERRNGVVMYALDNDVLSVVTAPWNRRGQDYLTHLVEGDSEAQESLAYIFAEYFLRKEESLRPLPFVVVSPGDAELEGLWNAIYFQAHQENVSLVEDFEAFLQHLDQTVLRDSGRPDEVVDFVQRLLSVLHRRRGAAAQLQRILRVQDSENIIPLDRMTAHGEPLVPAPDEAGLAEIERLEKFWLESLDRARPPRKRMDAGADVSSGWHRRDYPTNNSIDAAVLARIEWVNRRFESEKEVTRRLCFVTGDRHIERLARKRGHNGSNIADSYIRNPTCFLADRDFFKLAKVQTPDFLARVARSDPDGADASVGIHDGGSLKDWVYVLFPDTPAKPGTGSEDREHAASGNIEIEVQAAARNWARYLKLAAADAGIREANEEFEGYVNDLLRDPEFRSKLKDLMDQVLLVGNDAMTRFGVSGVLAGFWSLDADHRWSDRTIPAVKFESFPRATELINDILAVRDLRSAQVTLTRARIELLKRESPIGYTVFVAFALAFAHANAWPNAFTVARAAFSLAANFNSGQGESPVKGDEAAYLCAVFCRYCARREEDLNECESWLAVARERQMAEPRRASIARLPGRGNLYEDPRFLAEDLAISLARTNFVAFPELRKHEGTGPLEHESRRLSMVEQLRIASVDRICARHLSLLSELQYETSEVVKASLRQQLATNFLQLQLLARHKNLKHAEMPEKAAEIVRMLADTVEPRVPIEGENRRSREWPTIVEFTFLCGSALYLPEAAGWDRVENRETLLERAISAGSRLRVMPYDETRSAAFIGLVKAAMGL